MDGVSQSTIDKDTCLRQAIAMRKERRLDESVSLLSDGLERFPEDLTIMQELSKSLWMQGKHEHAEALADKILANDPSNKAALITRIDAYRQRRDIEAALACLERATAQFPGDVQFWLRHGALLRLDGRPEDSVSFLREKIQRKPGHTQLIYELALSLYDVGDRSGGEERLVAILADQPGHIGARTALINALSTDNRLQDALSLVDEVTDGEDATSRFSMRRAKLLWHLGDDAAAISQLERLRTTYPLDPKPVKELYLALRQCGRFNEAGAVLRDFVRTDDASDAVLEAKVEFCLQDGRSHAAMGFAQSWVQGSDDKVEALLALMEACVAALNVDEVQAIETRLLGLDTGSEKFTRLRAAHRRAIWDFEAAARLLEDHLSQLPASPELRLQLFELSLLMEDTDRCNALLDSHFLEMSSGLVNYVIYLVARGAIETAQALLDRLEQEISSGVLPRKEANLRETLKLLTDFVTGARPPSAQRPVDVMGEPQGHRPGGAGEDAQPRYAGLARFPDVADLLFDWDHSHSLITPEALSLAYSISPPSEPGYDDWYRKIQKATDTSRLLGQYYTRLPEKFIGLKDKCDFPEQELFAEHLKAGQSFLIVSAHQGPNVVAWWLAEHFPQLRIIANAPSRDASTSLSRAPLLMDGSAASVRELKRSIAQGSPLAGSLDQPFSSYGKFDETRFSIELSLFNLPAVKVPNLLPRLAWKYRLPSFWMDTCLVKNRIVLRAVRLPDRREGADWDTWSQEWMAAYKSNLEDYMRLGPEYLNAGQPILADILRAIHKGGLRFEMAPKGQPIS